MLNRNEIVTPHNRSSTAAFSRFDLLLVIVILLIVTALFYSFVINTEPKQHLQICRENQHKIGSAFAEFMEDNGGNLPYAAIMTNRFAVCSWDFSLRYYLSDGVISTNTPFSLNARAKGQEVAKMFRCPADSIVRVNGNRPRSYAMPLHRATPKDWPPSSESLSGVGLSLRITFDDDGKAKRMPKWRHRTFTNGLTYINKSIVSTPSDTMMMTEYANSKNIVYNLVSTIRTTSQHVEDTIPIEDYHGGIINYLMVDGHVESLTPEQTVGWDGKAGTNFTSHRGIWTIKAGD